MACDSCRKIDTQQKDPILNTNITWKEQNTISHVFSQWDPSIAVTLASSRRTTKTTAAGSRNKIRQSSKAGVGGMAIDGRRAAADALGGRLLPWFGSSNLSSDHVQPWVEGGRIRQCTEAGGDPMVHGVEAFEYEGELECVLRGWATGLHHEDHEDVGRRGRIRSEYGAVGEGGRSCEAMEGLALSPATVGTPGRPAVGTLLLTSSLHHEKQGGPAAGGGGTIPRTTGARRGSSTGGAARRKHARWRRDSSPEDGGGAGRPLRAAAIGTGAKTIRRRSTVGRGRRSSDSEGSREKGREAAAPVVGLGGEPGEGTRSRRGGWDSGDDVRRPRGAGHDSSDEDDDGSDSFNAAISSGRGSGLKNAGNFAAAERKPRKRQHREIEKYNAKNGGDGRTVYRDKSGRRREVDPAADETERPGLRGRRRRGRYGRKRVRGRGPRGIRARGRFLHDSRGGDQRPVPRGAEEGRDLSHGGARLEEAGGGIRRDRRRALSEARTERRRGDSEESAEECPLFIGNFFK
ncbi:hypothetical protein THAOC_10662 [Thalassiosira oceanica]|uniref:Uncharacterized protein n=1 Tax=Thalassiosira oceanica TaxID=159749 RepID=K0TCK9_THAOC|nr:hypothetical protein THAOC_10662 [Thalassiosira oceanica]|eukprot:EJK68182.1 hypothetical protein THAOC_10662 [Thalassiosira oceanica]